MKVFKGNNVPGLYSEILREILLEGIEVGPRGFKTKELSPVYIEVDNPRRRLFGHPHRKEVSIFTYIEGLWILRGESTPSRLTHYVKRMGDYVNDKTGEFDGAYGPRLRRIWPLQYREWSTCLSPISSTSGRLPLDQFYLIYRRLQDDPQTRQAVCVIYNPVYDWGFTKDLPCTLTFQFLQRNNALDMIVNMRSQDAWLGLVYDTGEFQWFQEIIAGWLGIEVGRYIHINGSLHLYEKDWVKAQEVVDFDFNYSLYDQVKTMDARLDFSDYRSIEKDLATWEEACREGDFDAVKEWDAQNDFYLNLADIIMAYNLRLEGKKKEAYEIVEANYSDLGRIYEARWKNAD